MITCVYSSRIMFISRTPRRTRGRARWLRLAYPLLSGCCRGRSWPSTWQRCQDGASEAGYNGVHSLWRCLPRPEAERGRADVRPAARTRRCPYDPSRGRRALCPRPLRDAGKRTLRGVSRVRELRPCRGCSGSPRHGRSSRTRETPRRVRLPASLRGRGHNALRPREGSYGHRLVLAAGRTSARPRSASGRGRHRHKEWTPLYPASDAPSWHRCHVEGQLLPLQHRERSGHASRSHRARPRVLRGVREMNMMRELYTQVIMDHYQRPRNRGELENARLEAHLLNPLCGDEITVYATFIEGSVADVKFSGQGCSISQASASMMTERLMGKSREAAKAQISHFKSMMVGDREFPEQDDLAVLKGVIQYPSRIKCATLAWTAFQQGLEEVAKGDGS